MQAWGSIEQGRVVEVSTQSGFIVDKDCCTKKTFERHTGDLFLQ